MTDNRHCRMPSLLRDTRPQRLPQSAEQPGEPAPVCRAQSGEQFLLLGRPYGEDPLGQSETLRGETQPDDPAVVCVALPPDQTRSLQTVRVLGETARADPAGRRHLARRPAVGLPASRRVASTS